MWFCCSDLEPFYHTHHLELAPPTVQHITPLYPTLVSEFTLITARSWHYIAWNNNLKLCVHKTFHPIDRPLVDPVDVVDSITNIIQSLPQRTKVGRKYNWSISESNKARYLADTDWGGVGSIQSGMSESGGTLLIKDCDLKSFWPQINGLWTTIRKVDCGQNEIWSNNSWSHSSSLNI